VWSDLPVGTSTVDHPEWVIPVGWTPTHGLPPLEALLTTDAGIEIRPYTAGFEAMVHGGSDDPLDRPHIGVALMRPRSRGRLAIVSADPTVPPLIEHRYDSAPDDVADLAGGAEIARDIVSGTVGFGEPAWSTSQHLAGTAPMGAENDRAAVLDNRCRVRGVAGLWVVDGSIMPDITSRGPHATITMIGHRAAEFVSG
jgi:choline dehydrogenase-like flavoprotein